MQTGNRSLNDMLAAQDAAVVLQARMSSNRVPGKMLREADGKPLVEHVLDRFRFDGPMDRVWIAPSDDPSDDPLAARSRPIGAKVYRGSLHGVGLARQEGFMSLIRVSADSPFLDVGVVRDVLALFDGEVDLATNVGKRTFPKGQSVEVIRVSKLAELHPEMTPEDREHVTTFFYRPPGRLRLVDLESGGDHGDFRMVVDTEDDWVRFSHAVETLGSRAVQMNWRQIMSCLHGP